jgi:hypothetical protein
MNDYKSGTCCPVDIMLKPYELMLGAHVGMMRRVRSVELGCKDHHGIPGKTWEYDLLGAIGEMAIAKLTDRFWEGTVNTFKNQGDVGEWEVRTTESHTNKLIVRPEDPDDSIFWFVSTESITIYRVHGWILGSDAKQKVWEKSPNNRPAAFFVPSDALQKDWSDDCILDVKWD